MAIIEEQALILAVGKALHGTDSSVDEGGKPRRS